MSIMRKRKKAVCVSGIMLLALVAALSLWIWNRAAPRKPDPIARGDYSYTIEYAEYRIHQLMRQHHLPSVAVALIDDQDIVWREAFGLADVEQGLPATVDTVYKQWSVSKVFTAIEIMRLAEEGLLDLDDPITDYLPDLSIQSRFEDSEPITIRSILAHHSGLPRNGCRRVEYRPGDGDGLAELAGSLDDCHVVFPVGRRYHYSNIGPDILGYIVQVLRGEDFPRYMRENLLAPIGMDNSAFASIDIAAQSDFALGYEYYQGENYPLVQRDIASLPSGNLYSTLEDMSDFARFVFRDGEANGRQIIGAETLSLMFEDQYASSQPMGLGWKTARLFGSERMIWHDGGPSEGIGSLVALMPERKLGVVLFANEISFEGPVSVSLAVDILELMLETRYGIVPPAEAGPEPVTLDRSRLDDYAGRYIAFGEVMDVYVSGDRLQASVLGMEFDLIPLDQNRFRVGHWLVTLGLADILPLPLDLRELEIEFLAGGELDEEMMIIKISDFLHEICSRYPEFSDIPAQWEQLAGDYELVYRLPSGLAGSEVVGRSEIRVEGGVLRMPGAAGPLLPISETEILLLSGPFAGETMLYEPGTGFIYHQAIVYKPIF